MVLGTINPQREAELRGLLESMNEAPGRVNAKNAVVPFGQFDTLHFARFVILKDNSLDDVLAHGLPRRDYPLYLAFLGTLDGDPDTFLKDVACEHRRDCAQFFRVAGASHPKPISSTG